MWFYKGSEFTSEMIGKNLGFVYVLTDLENGKKYVGKKKFWSKITRPPLKGKTRKRKEIRESDWQNYFGSSLETQALVEQFGAQRFHREILHLCETAGVMGYLELKEQVDRNVLLDDSYYNGIIQARIHRSHVKSLKNMFTNEKNVV
jgi:hypothetical protein